MIFFPEYIDSSTIKSVHWASYSDIFLNFKITFLFEDKVSPICQLGKIRFLNCKELLKPLAKFQAIDIYYWNDNLLLRSVRNSGGTKYVRENYHSPDLTQESTSS